MKYEWNRLYDLLRDTVSLMMDEGDTTSDRYKELQTLLERVKRGRTPHVYCLGYADPITHSSQRPAPLSAVNAAETAEFKPVPSGSRTYTSFAGVDICVYAARAGSKELVQAADLQGISIMKHPFVGRPDALPAWEAYMWGGSMIALLFDRSEFDPEDAFDFLFLQSMNEYGHCSYCALEQVKILRYGHGVSIDDITMDINMEYGAHKYHAWRTGMAVRSELGQFLLTDMAEEEMQLVGKHRLPVLKGWRAKWDQALEDLKKSSEDKTKR